MQRASRRGRQTAPLTPLYTSREAMEYLGVSRATLVRLRERGDLVGRKVGSQWRFRLEDLQAAVKPQTGEPRPAIRPGMRAAG